MREENMSLKDNIDDLSAEREDMKKKLSKPKSRVTIVTSVHRGKCFIFCTLWIKKLQH